MEKKYGFNQIQIQIKTKELKKYKSFLSLVLAVPIELASYMNVSFRQAEQTLKTDNRVG